MRWLSSWRERPSPERLRHQVHEVKRPLPVVEGLPALLLARVGLDPQPVHGDAERGHERRGAADEG